MAVESRLIEAALKRSAGLAVLGGARNSGSCGSGTGAHLRRVLPSQIQMAVGRGVLTAPPKSEMFSSIAAR
jgi:hypothetical protein